MFLDLLGGELFLDLLGGELFLDLGGELLELLGVTGNCNWFSSCDVEGSLVERVLEDNAGVALDDLGLLEPVLEGLSISSSRPRVGGVCVGVNERGLRGELLMEGNVRGGELVGVGGFFFRNKVWYLLSIKYKYSKVRHNHGGGIKDTGLKKDQAR